MVIEKAKAHERNILEYKDHQASHRGANSMPSYNNPLLSAHASAKQRPSSQNTCHQCGESHEQGNCTTCGKVCGKCKGPNHFKAICHSKVTAARTVPTPHSKKQSQLTRRTSMGSTSGNGRGVGGRQFSKKKMPKKHLPKQKTYEVTFKNPKMALSGVTPAGEYGNVLDNPVLSGKVPEKEGMYNRFSCYAVNSKMAQSTKTKSKPLEGLYRDNDPDNWSEIITDHNYKGAREDWYHDDGG